ncbi:MAG TPA: hypothetical protein DD400_04365 [Rhodospirillaceae bacterium]|nr:hypothetical protein [Rhodospirillaceae bacterium]
MKKTYLIVAPALFAVLLAAAPAFSEATSPTMMGQGKAVPAFEKGKGMRAQNPAMQKMRAAMMTMKEEGKALREQVMAKRKEMNALIKAEKFDKVAFLAKHKEVQALQQKMGTMRAETKANVLAGMTLAERASLPDMGKRMFKGKGRGKGPMGYGRGNFGGREFGGQAPQSPPQ